MTVHFDPRFRGNDWREGGRQRGGDGSPVCALDREERSPSADTLDRVLNLSKLGAGEMSFSASTLDLATEVEDTAQQFEPQAEEARIDLRVEIGF